MKKLLFLLLTVSSIAFAQEAPQEATQDGKRVKYLTQKGRSTPIKPTASIIPIDRIAWNKITQQDIDALSKVVTTAKNTTEADDKFQKLTAIKSIGIASPNFNTALKNLVAEINRLQEAKNEQDIKRAINDADMKIRGLIAKSRKYQNLQNILTQLRQEFHNAVYTKAESLNQNDDTQRVQLWAKPLINIRSQDDRLIEIKNKAKDLLQRQSGRDTEVWSENEEVTVQMVDEGVDVMDAYTTSNATGYEGVSEDNYESTNNNGQLTDEDFIDEGRFTNIDSL
jgi:hypothetical protein